MLVLQESLFHFDLLDKFLSWQRDIYYRYKCCLPSKVLYFEAVSLVQLLGVLINCSNGSSVRNGNDKLVWHLQK